MKRFFQPCLSGLVAASLCLGVVAPHGASAQSASTPYKNFRLFMDRQSGTQGLQRVNYSYNNVDELSNEQAIETTAIAGVPFVRNEYSYDRMGKRSNLTARNIINTTSTQQVHDANNLNQLSTLVSTPYTGTTVGTATNNTYNTYNDTTRILYLCFKKRSVAP